MRHIHADHIIAAANDTSIEWEYLDESGDWCSATNEPYWSINVKYRQKAKSKKTVDMWQWAYVHQDGGTYTTRTFFRTEEKARKSYSDVKIYRIEGSKITVEVDE